LEGIEGYFVPKKGVGVLAQQTEGGKFKCP